MIKLETPLTIEKVESLRVGDQVLLSGTIYTGRDAAHKRFVEAINNNEPLPFDPYDQVIYFVGPTPTKPGHIIGKLVDLQPLIVWMLIPLQCCQRD